jgi:predicted HNH restriction endonuclease
MRRTSVTRLFTLTILTSLWLSIASASDYPTRGIVYGKSQAASITYSCSKVDDELHCEMNQLLISRKTKPEDVEKDLQQLNAMAKDLVKDEKSLAECQKMTSKFKKVMSDLKAPKYSLTEGRRKQLEEISPKAREELQTLGRLLINYCTKPTTANREALVQYQLEERKKTCTALVNNWTEVFVRPQGLTAGNVAV